MGGVKRQRGMTFMGWMLTLVLVGFLAFVLVKVFPVYMNQYKISSVLESLGEDQRLVGASRAAVRERVRKLFNINDVEYVDASDLEISASRDTRTVRLAYEVRQPFSDHIAVIFRFDNSVAIAGGAP